MTIHLTETREHFVRSLMEGGRYSSASEVIEEALRLLEQRDRKLGSGIPLLEAQLIEGIDSGPSTPMPTSDWDDIEREGQQIIAARKVNSAR